MSDTLKSLRGSAAIAGVATFGNGESPGFTDMELLARSARAAVADAGLKMSDIDGLCTASAGASMWAMPVIEYLGLNPTYIDGTMLGGSSFIAHLLPRCRRSARGSAARVLVCYGSAQRTSTLGRREIGQLPPLRRSAALRVSLRAHAAGVRLRSRRLAPHARVRHDARAAGRRRRGRARLGRLNPEAFMRDPLSREDVLKSRMVSDPLTVRDCCLVTDGGGAYVLVSAERAKSLPKKPVYVLGNATAVWNRQISAMQDLTVTSARQSGAQAFAMAGLQPADIDVLQLYDAFTINTILFLEDLGFCPKGEGGRFVENGTIAPGGRLPVNTNGGGLSCTHPGMYGIFALIEAVRQLRGEAGERQVQGVRTALAHGNGGTLSSQSTAILGTGDTL
jgi:hypothetical protein